MWNVLENGYLEPHANTRIDFNRERGKVSPFDLSPRRAFFPCRRGRMTRLLSPIVSVALAAALPIRPGSRVPAIGHARRPRLNRESGR